MRRRGAAHTAAVLVRSALALALGLLPARARAESDAVATRADCVGDYCASDAIYQFAPAAAFAASLFEGPTPFGDVLRLGDFGLGGTSPLEGEVIIVDGTAYHASPTGEIEILPPTARTSFAFVKHFRPDRRVELPPIGSLAQLSRALDEALPSPNLFYAARIDARFDWIQLRSVQRQHPPYPSLADVVAAQSVFAAAQIEGTLVGYRFPAYLGGVNAGGWHFHFVDDARRLGGHVLDVRAAPVTAALDQTRALTLVLPDDDAFDAANLQDPGAAAAFGAAVRPEIASTPDDALPVPSVAATPSAAAPDERDAGE